MGFKLTPNGINYRIDESILWEKWIIETKITKGPFYEKDIKTKTIKRE